MMPSKSNHLVKVHLESSLSLAMQCNGGHSAGRWPRSATPQLIHTGTRVLGLVMGQVFWSQGVQQGFDLVEEQEALV